MERSYLMASILLYAALGSVNSRTKIIFTICCLGTESKVYKTTELMLSLKTEKAQTRLIKGVSVKNTRNVTEEVTWRESLLWFCYITREEYNKSELLYQFVLLGQNVGL